MLIDNLVQLGLSEKESRVYLAALELGPTTILELAKKTSVKRSTIYEFINNLIDKELLAESVRGKKKIFIPSDPRKFESLVEKQKSLLKEILPELLSINQLTATKPKTQIYEGITGVKKALNDTLTTNQPIFAFCSMNNISGEVLDYLSSRYRQKRIKKKIYLQAIVSSDLPEQIFSADDKFFSNIFFVDPKKFPGNLWLNIYGRKISFISYNKNSRLFSAIIDDESLARSMKSFFDLAWLGAKKKISQRKNQPISF